MPLWRIAVIIFTVCIQQVWGGDEITGYAGQSVVLKSGAYKSWDLTKVEWSLFKNTTYIATLRDGVLAVDRFWRYKGRLVLNSRTGDLTIKNLRIDDSMIYTVTLVNSNSDRKENKLNLTVKERLKKPNILHRFSSLKNGQCHILLKCDASDKNVNLSWTPLSGLNVSYMSETDTDIPKPILWMSFSGNRNVTLNCTASSGQQIESEQITVGCIEETIMPIACSLCSCASMVILGIMCTVAIFLCGLLYAYKEKLKDAYIDGPLHVFQCLFNC